MNTKNLLVSFVTLALALFLVGSVSAANMATISDVTVNGISVDTSATVSVVAGQDMTVKVYFTADEDDTDVVLTATVEGEKVDFDASSAVFDVIAGKAYRKVLTLKVPYELKDVKNDTLELNIELDGKNHKTEADYALTVQRPSYNAVVKSVTVPSTISAGDSIPVEIVLKNMGYNDLDDVYVTAKIVEADVSQGPKWFGDLVALEDCNSDCDKDDTVVGNLYLRVPYGVEAGVYTLEVTVQNDDTETTVARKIAISNDFPSNVIASTTSKTVKAGESATYDLLIVNPTNNVKVYTIVADGDVSSTNQIIAVPAGSSKTTTVVAKSDKAGTYTFNVNVISAGKVESTLAFDLNVEENTAVNSIVVLTIVLAVIFLVLLVVLIILLGKKPEKADEFGESYY